MAKKTANGKRPAPLFETLEPRLLLSAEGLGAMVADAGLDNDLELPQSPAEIALLRVDDSVQAEGAAVSQSRELVIVDPRTPDYQALVDDLLARAGAGRNIDVIVLDATRDGIEQVGEALARYQVLDAVHIVSHGAADSLQLGGSLLEFDTLLANARAIQGWGSALNGDADLLIYGCDLASSAAGQGLVDSLSRLTGADVAASDDPTGHASLGGDWDLEYRAGHIETAIALSAEVRESWTGLLAAPDANDDPGTFNADVLSYSPVSYWRLGESAGPTAMDSGSTAANGTYNGPSLGQADAINGDPDTAAGFVRANADYIEIAHDDAWLLNEGTVQLWFNADDLANDQTLISKDSLGFDTGGHVDMQVLTDGSVHVRFQSTSASYLLNSGAGSVNAASWHHVAFTFGSGGMELYLDGRRVDTDAYTGGLGTTSGGAGNFEPLVIGAGTQISGDLTVTPLQNHFNGRIDEVAIFGAQLTGPDIARVAGGALQHYTLDEDGAINVPASEGVLVNDYDQEDDPLTAVLVSGPANAASFSLSPDGSFSYTPAADFSGADSFTYKGNDGTADSNVATVTITVNPLNDAPVLASWYDSDWLYRKEVSVDAAQVSGDLTGFPVLVRLNTDADLAGFAQADGDDILFTSSDGTSKLAHEIESFDPATGDLVAWVKTDLSGSHDTRLFLYFGNLSTGNQQAPTNVWDTNFQSVWHLNNTPTGAVGEIADSTGGNDGTTQGGMDAADLVTAKVGQGLDFDALDDHILVPNSASLDGTSDAATFELWAWFQDAADGNHQIIMTSSNRFDSAPNDGYEWALRDPDGVGGTRGDLFFYPWGGADPNYVLGTNPITDQVWHHLAVTLDYAAGDVAIYVDGVEMSYTQNTLANWTSQANPADWLWGGNPDRSSRYFDGMMDEIRVSDVVRSEDWLQTTVSNQNNPAAFSTLGGLETNPLTLTDVAEDGVNPPGNTVSAVLASAGGDPIADVDGDPEGIAVVGVDDTNGTWQYDAGGGWTAFGAVSDGAAVLLDPGALIRFVPDPDYNGTAGNLTFRAWDQTLGASGDTGVNITALGTGGSNAFSTNSDSATLTVTPVNDAPTLAATSPTLPSITEDETANGGALVSTLLGGVSDPDAAPLEGVAITGLSGNGTWQYKLGAGAWTDVGAVAGNSALLLRSTDQVRYLPDAQNGETATFGFRAWDQSDGASAGIKVNPGAGGGTTAFSTTGDTASVTVTDVNDNPTATANSNAVTEDTALLASGNVLTDDDGAGLDSDVDTGDTLTVTEVDGETIPANDVTGSYGSLNWATDGSYTYTLDNLNPAVQTLNFGATLTDTFTYTLSDANAGTSTANLTITIQGRDDVTFAINSTATVSEGGPTAATFTVTVGGAVSAGNTASVDITAGGSATDGSDYSPAFATALSSAAASTTGVTLLGNTLTFDNAFAGPNFAFTVNAQDDGLFEPTETITATLSGASTANGAASIGTAVTSTDLTDNDGATASLAINDLTVNEAAGTATLTVTLSGNVAGGFTVDYASSDGTASAGTDYTATSGTLNFTGTNAETQTVVVAITDDDLVEANETLNVVLSNLSNGLVSFSDDTGVVTLTNDDNTPVVTAAQSFTVGELAGNGTALGSVAATDADAGTTFQSWTIVSGNTGGLFDINPATGELTVLDNTTLDFETLPTSYTLGITVSDGTNTSATQTVAVNVTDVPASITVGQVFGISEAAANASAVGSVAATGDTAVSFAITAGNTGTAFAIDNAGNITVNNTNQLNFEGTSSYTLTLAVGDGSSTTNQTVTVNLTDANDAPVLDNSPAPTLTTITEDNLTNPGNQLLSLLGAWVTDDDAGAFEGIALTGLTSGNGTWQFSTDGGGSWSNTGAVADNNALLLGDGDHVRFVPDGQNADSGSITYRAWDRTSGAAGTKVNASSNGGTTAFSTASETAAITVTALNDAPTLAGASYSLAPASPVGTALGAVAGSDVDTGDTLTYAITAGNTGGAFTIDPATGQLSVADSTGLTDGAGFNLTVQVQDSGAPMLSDTASVNIQVNTPPAVTPPPVQPPPVIEPPPAIEPPSVIEPAPPPDTDDPDEPEPEEDTGSLAGGGTAQPNTPADSTVFFGEQASPAALTGVDELRYGDRDRSRPSLTDRPDLYDGPPPVQLQQVVAAAEPIALPEMQEPALWGALDMMAAQMNDAEEWRAQERERQVTLQATTGVAFTLSAGFVTWLLRAGTLATSLLSSMPLWRGFDPLPVVGFTAREHKRLKAAAGRLHKDEAQAHPDVERLFDRAPESASKPKKKVRRKARLKDGRRAASIPSP